jgi:hypothetical protein
MRLLRAGHLVTPPLNCSVRRQLERTTLPYRSSCLSMSAPRRPLFLKWASHCLVGHIVLFLVAGSVPCFLFFLYLDYSDGVALTLRRVTYLGLLWALAGLAVATLGWYTVSLPLIKARDKRPG